MEIMERDQKLKEIREALDAGKMTLHHLDNARAQLDSASNFGFADMLGFDLIGGIGKHMKIGNAKRELEMAKQQVVSFQKEIKDVQGILDFQIDMGDFLTFADFLFDGILADVFVQSKIEEAKKQVDVASWQIHKVMDELYRMENELL